MDTQSLIGKLAEERTLTDGEFLALLGSEEGDPLLFLDIFDGLEKFSVHCL